MDKICWIKMVNSYIFEMVCGSSIYIIESEWPIKIKRIYIGKKTRWMLAN